METSPHGAASMQFDAYRASFLCAQLRDARAQWNDESLMAAFALLASAEHETHGHIDLINSQLLAPVLRSPNEPQALARHERMITALRHSFDAAPRLLLMPVHEAGHWSLLAYAPAWHRWYHADSALGLHRVPRLIERLDTLQLVRVTSSDRLVSFPDLPQQRDATSCGAYVAFYMWVLMRNLGAMLAKYGDEDDAWETRGDEFRALLDRELPTVRDALCPEFLQRLGRLLDAAES